MLMKSRSWKIGIGALLCAALMMGDTFAQKGGRDGGGGRGNNRGGSGQRGGGGGGSNRGGGEVNRGGGGNRGGDSRSNRGGGGSIRGRGQGGSGGAIRGGGGSNRGGGVQGTPGGGNRGGAVRGVPGDGNRGGGVRDGNRGSRGAGDGGIRGPGVRDGNRLPQAGDGRQQERRRPDFDNQPGRDGRDSRRDDRDGRTGRERDGRDGRDVIRDGRDGRDFIRDGRGDRDGRDWTDRRDGRDGRDDRDGRRDRDWGRGDGRRWDNNDWNNRWSNNWNNGWGWNNSGWNGRWQHRHRNWRNGFWGWNRFGYRPWWGGYGGYGGLTTLLSLGFGVGNYGYGYPYGYGYGGFGSPYGYGYGNTWGYGTWLNSGYYYNPYYATPLTLGSTVIDYSQPLVQYTTVLEQSSNDDTYSSDSDPTTDAAMAEFETARAAFKVGDYNSALDAVHRALELLPNDTALHEFRALVLFAQGNYRDAAATVHAVLAEGPGWDWETMSALYPSVDVYTAHLRALEEYAMANPDSADARFLLGYQYLTEGYTEAGLRQFQKVVALEPKDLLAQRIVESAMPETDATGTADAAESAAAANAQAAPAVEAPPATAPSAEVQAQAPELPAQPTAEAAASAEALPADSGVTPTVEQMTGNWSATHEGGASFALELTADSQFTWTYTEGDKNNTLTGTYSLANGMLILEPADGEPMIARITDLGESGFRFRMVGAPKEDQGLQFAK